VVDVLNIQCYVLPTIGHYSAFIDVDIDTFSQEHGKTPHTLRINVHSPKSLDQGELIRIESQLKKEWGRYIVEREQTHRFYKWFKILAPIELVFVLGLILIDLLVLKATLRAIWDIFFWTLILGFTGIIPGLRSLSTRKREETARQLLKNWKGTETVEANDENIKLTLKEFNKTFTETNGVQTEIYMNLKEYAAKINFKPGQDFYEWKIRDLVEEESFYTKYLPVSWNRQLRNFIFGVKIESPVVVAPVRKIEQEVDLS